MMRTLPVFALAAIASGASAQKSEADVRAVYARMNTLIAKHDAKGLVALFERTATPDFVSVMNGQKIGRAQFAADLRKGMSGPKPPSATSTVVGVKPAGTSLVVTVRWRMSMAGPDGKIMAGTLTSTNTWVRTPAGYRLKKIVEKWS